MFKLKEITIMFADPIDILIDYINSFLLRNKKIQAFFSE